MTRRGETFRKMNVYVDEKITRNFPRVLFLGGFNFWNPPFLFLFLFYKCFIHFIYLFATLLLCTLYTTVHIPYRICVLATVITNVSQWNRNIRFYYFPLYERGTKLDWVVPRKTLSCIPSWHPLSLHRYLLSTYIYIYGNWIKIFIKKVRRIYQ